MKYPTDHTLVFGGAGMQTVPESGRHVRVIEATDDVYIKIDDTSTELKRGVKSSVPYLPGFRKVQIRSLVAQTIRICISDDPQDEGRDDVAVTVSATVAPGDTLTSVADVSIPAGSSAEILPAGATNMTAIIKNLNGNTDTIRIGELAGVGAARGHELGPGESVALAVTAAIHGYNNGAADQSVSVLIVRDV